jgi:pyruvate/2-oxoglutarate dehydrogenase complex dihydrolipoamide dehydrogenase (E3) component
MNTEVTEKLIKNEKPDAVILCTGSIPLILDIPGIKDTGAVIAHDIFDGKVLAGQKVLVIGGGMVGAELADFLGAHNRNVTIIEMLPGIAMDEGSGARLYLMERLTKQKTEIITEGKVKKFINGGIVYEKDGDENTLSGFDTVALAMGTRAYNPLENAVKDVVKEVYVIGDAQKARKAIEAIREGADVGLKI